MKNRFRPIKVIISFCKKIKLDYHIFDKKNFFFENSTHTILVLTQRHKVKLSLKTKS